VDGLDAHLDGAVGPVLVDVLEREVGGAGAAEDVAHHREDRRVVSALEAAQLHRHQVGMPGRELRGPQLETARRGRGVLPHVGDVAGIADQSPADLVAEQPVQEVRVGRQRALGQDRVAERLQPFQDAVVDARVVVVDAAEHQDREAALALHAVEDLERPALEPGLEALLGGEALRDGPQVLGLRQPEQVAPGGEELARQQRPVGEVDERGDPADAVVAEDVGLLREGRLDHLRRGADHRARVAGEHARQRGGHDVDHRQEDAVEGRPAVSDLDQVVDVGHGDLRRVTRVGGAAPRAVAVEALAGGRRVDDVLRTHAQALQVRVEEGCVLVEGQHARDADA
jgi:hypothetical protein